MVFVKRRVGLYLVSVSQLRILSSAVWAGRRDRKSGAIGIQQPRYSVQLRSRQSSYVWLCPSHNKTTVLGGAGTKPGQGATYQGFWLS